jgi:hypothetical protein
MGTTNYRTTTHDGRTYLVRSLDLSGPVAVAFCNPIKAYRFNRATGAVTTVTVYGKPVRVPNPKISHGLPRATADRMLAEAEPELLRAAQVQLELRARLDTAVTRDVVAALDFAGMGEVVDTVLGVQAQYYRVAAELGIDFQTATPEELATVRELAK